MDRSREPPVFARFGGTSVETKFASPAGKPKRLARRSLPESKRRGEVWLPSSTGHHTSHRRGHPIEGKDSLPEKATQVSDGGATSAERFAQLLAHTDRRIQTCISPGALFAQA
jgi:hypothetical protein